MDTNLTQGWQCSLKSLNDTMQLAKLLAKQLPIPAVIGLTGTLGAGKTQLVRYFVQTLGGEADWVTSPTYVLLQSYATDPEVHHLDAYRIKKADEFRDLGVEELFDQPAYTWIEWSDKVLDAMPKDFLHIHMEPGEGNVRLATLRSVGPEFVEMIERIATRWK